jgi:glycosyltransferase involved in cell wall biosynthesis
VRITYLYQYFKTRNMSGGTRTYEMGRRLVDMGHVVTVITADSFADGHRGWRETNESGIRVLWASVPYSNSLSVPRRLAAFSRFAYLAGRKASTLTTDVILASSTPLTIALPGVWAKRRLDVPMVFEVRDLWPELPIAVGALRNPLGKVAARWLEAFAYRNSDRVIALSPGMKAGIAEKGVPQDRIKVIPNSCDLDLFDVPRHRGLEWRHRHPQFGDRPIVLYGGTIGRINGVGWLAQVAAISSDIRPEVCFVVIGSGGQRDQVQQIASELGILGRNFFLLPAMPKTEMADALSAATICISTFIDLPEMWNNSANKFFDGLAAGRPVALNYSGWQADLIEEQGAGLVLPVSDPTLAAKMIIEKVQDQRWLIAAGGAAQRLARERFDRRRLAEQLESLLLQVAVKAESISGLGL